MSSIQGKYLTQLSEIYSLAITAREISSEIRSKNKLTWCDEVSFIILSESTNYAYTILSIFPDSPIHSGFKGFILTPLSMFARYLSENLITVRYLYMDIDDNVLEFKKTVWDYHQRCERLSMLKQFGSQDPKIKTTEHEKDNLKNKILANSCLKNIEKNIRNNIINGTTEKIYSLDKIVNELKIRSNIHWSTYKQYSQFVHQTPFAIDQILRTFQQIDDETLAHFTTLLSHISAIFSIMIFDIMTFNNIKGDVLHLPILRVLEYWIDIYTTTKIQKYDNHVFYRG